MMQVLNVGSVNIDHVYAVDHFVRPGETLSSARYQVFAGGKGFNQSLALARAGAVTRHAGCVGRDAAWLVERLRAEGVDTTYLMAGDVPTGHAVIQVTPSGENAIVLYGGANRVLTPESVSEAVAACSQGDFLLVQNETSAVADAIRAGKRNGMKVVFNPAPMTADIQSYPLQDVDLFILNETEVEGLIGEQSPEAASRCMASTFPHAATILTMGRQGALYADAGGSFHQPALPVTAVDTTAAGDTFAGFFLAELMRTADPRMALALGCAAAAVCVTRPGASDSIPGLQDLRTAGSADLAN